MSGPGCGSGAIGPFFFIDIAVPRDVDPRVNEIDNVYVYDIDDLQGVIDLNREERLSQARLAEHIIDEETIKFRNWMNSLSAGAHHSLGTTKKLRR